jgi:hypothetical protein
MGGDRNIPRRCQVVQEGPQRIALVADSSESSIYCRAALRSNDAFQSPNVKALHPLMRRPAEMNA